MALPTVCGGIKNGQDNSCTNSPSRYFQQAVIINMNDIDTKTINTTDLGEGCNRNVQFTLKAGKTGYRFTLSENGTAINGTFDKSTNDFGYPQFLHRVNLALNGLTEQDKCTLEGLSKGRFVVALQIGDIVEVYGIQNGLTAGDFTYDLQGNSGFVQLALESSETAQEPNVPLVYKSAVAGQEIEDFDSNFEQTA